MIRYFFVHNQILSIYSSMTAIKFPLDLKDIISRIPNCKYMSYQDFAKLNNCSIDEVIAACESNSGCTNYNITNDKYLILCNEDTKTNPLGRQRFTIAHEIGHIICHHLNLPANLASVSNVDFEAEADYFAAMLLAPFPLFRALNIESQSDIHFIFGLSNQASEYQFLKYLSWKSEHRKTAWENDLLRLYYQKTA